MPQRDLEGEYVARDAREVLGLIRASKPPKESGHSSSYSAEMRGRQQPPAWKGRGDYDEEVYAKAQEKDRRREGLFHDDLEPSWSGSRGGGGGEKRRHLSPSTEAAAFTAKMNGDPLMARDRLSRERNSEARLKLEEQIARLEEALEKERAARLEREAYDLEQTKVQQQRRLQITEAGK